MKYSIYILYTFYDDDVIFYIYIQYVGNTANICANLKFECMRNLPRSLLSSNFYDSERHHFEFFENTIYTNTLFQYFCFL